MALFRLSAFLLIEDIPHGLTVTWIARASRTPLLIEDILNGLTITWTARASLAPHPIEDIPPTV
jgi:hypothetical protein